MPREEYKLIETLFNEDFSKIINNYKKGVLIKNLIAPTDTKQDTVDRYYGSD